MSLARLYTKTFDSALDLCIFVNENSISVIEQIIIKDNTYVLFYR